LCLQIQFPVVIVRLVLLPMNVLIFFLNSGSRVIRYHWQEIRLLLSSMLKRLIEVFTNLYLRVLDFVQILQFHLNLLTLFQKESKELAHGKSALIFKWAFLIFPIMTSVKYQDFVVWNLFHLDIKHGNQVFDVAIGVEVGKKHDHLAERYLVVLENVLCNLVPLLYDEIIETLLLLQADILILVVLVEARGCSLKVILKEEITDFEASAVKLSFDEHVYLKAGVDLRALHETLNVCVLSTD